MHRREVAGGGAAATARPAALGAILGTGGAIEKVLAVLVVKPNFRCLSLKPRPDARDHRRCQRLQGCS
eukprot:scaffold11699_cov109-Isochrysis_galbana.AAC.11